MHKEWMAAWTDSILTTARRIPLLRLMGQVLLLVVSLPAWPGSTLQAQTAAELIEQAKQFDSGYTAGPDASQHKALDFYRQALHANPDSSQRLRILFRMAQLHSSAYLVHRGEAPNYPRAISLYEQILATYPTQEPQVVQSMTALADCFINLRRFDEALYWSKRTLDVSTRSLEERIKAWETQDPARPDHGRDPPTESQPLMNPVELQRILRQLQRSQCAAVDQIASAALRIDPLWAQAELQTVEERYTGSCIAQRAREILDRQANAISDTLAPSKHIPPDAGTSALQNSAPAAPPPSSPGDLRLEPSPATPPADGNTLRLTRVESPPLQPLPSRAPRGPPLAHLGWVVTGAAGLMVMAWAAVLARKLLAKGTKP